MATRSPLPHPISMIVFLFFPILFSACARTLASSNSKTITPSKVYLKLINEEQNEITVERLARIGKLIIFGTDDPRGVLARGEVPIGKGQCPLCHKFFQEHKADRGPALIAVEARSHFRIKEERYQAFSNRLSKGDDNSGIIPHAQTGGEYLLESEYCPNCYTVTGYGIKGTNDLESAMPIINKPPIKLTDFEIVAVVAYLQSHDTPGDYSKVTVLKDWEHYFGKKLPITSQDICQTAHLECPPRSPAELPSPPVALNSDTPEKIVQKMTCHLCHKIPGISIAKTGAVGPLLIMKTNAVNRIKSPEYQQAVKEGRAHATTAREYVIESIIDPGAFIVPGFADDMLKDYRHKFTVGGLDRLVDYLMEQDEAAAIQDGLDRLSSE